MLNAVAEHPGDIAWDDIVHQSRSGVSSGLLAGTQIATGGGWKTVEEISAGDKVLTFDAGLQTVTKVAQTTLWDGDGDCPVNFWPLSVPAGALGNRQEIMVLPCQSILTQCGVSEEIHGDPFSLIPARAANGMHGISRIAPERDMQVVILHFAKEQVVFTRAGALFQCPACKDTIEQKNEEKEQPFYPLLRLDEARFLLHQIEDSIADAFSFPPVEAFGAVAPA